MNESQAVCFFDEIAHCAELASLTCARAGKDNKKFGSVIHFILNFRLSKETALKHALFDCQC